MARARDDCGGIALFSASLEYIDEGLIVALLLVGIGGSRGESARVMKDDTSGGKVILDSLRSLVSWTFSGEGRSEGAG